ncbi:hypothetical protein IIU_05748 [Bacillus cereus VD133]|uniref:Uncharacterized protein n=1 Tax=Bacillus cereus VD133 TaxID=1053233 RepID=A0A9W5UZX9_BACCE|nr:hypothetical protein [Bacillus cereus]EOO28630.1 hypothetical protein IIU_05748 [Bacillus cereus VD133]
MLERKTLTYQCDSCRHRERVDTSRSSMYGRSCEVCGKQTNPERVVVIAGNVKQAKEYWKRIKDKYQYENFQVKFLSNRPFAIDGISHRSLFIILCGDYWENVFYESKWYDSLKKLGVRIVHERI